tara:strand:- start:3446 stop:4087 length:642 start_codon:yes stop_codon:yes gene_type:complete
MSDFIFNKENGDIKFVGDFESLYVNEKDPWLQSSKEPSEMRKYYEFSRQNLLDVILSKKLTNILEVGCGLGETTNLIKEETNTNIDGLDISHTAIEKASNKYRDIKFHQGNILDFRFRGRYQTLIMSQCLWYILHEFDSVISNITSQLKPFGHILFSQAFLKEQKYGCDVIDGYHGLVEYFDNHEKYDFIYSEYNQNDMIHHDGIVLVRRRSL